MIECLLQFILLTSIPHYDIGENDSCQSALLPHNKFKHFVDHYLFAILYLHYFSVIALLCYCDPCIGVEGISNGTCVAYEYSKCFTSIKIVHEGITAYEEWHYGCFAPEEQTVMQVNNITVLITKIQNSLKSFRKLSDINEGLIRLN